MHSAKTIKQAILLTEAKQSRCAQECLDYKKDKCQTGPSTRMLLNNLLATDCETYLEVGMYYGGSISSALSGNKVKCAYGIDALHPGYEEEMRDGIKDKVRRFHKPGNGPVVLAFEDAFKFDLERINDPVTVYFYDADHTVEGHRKALTYFWQVLADKFVFVVDDWDLNDTREGTAQALAELGKSDATFHEFHGYEDYYMGVGFALIQK